jgi:hypothetical protein
MRRFATLITTLALALSGLVFSPAHASVPSDGTYLCTTGVAASSTPNYTITNGAVLDGSSCAGDVVIPDGVTSIGTAAFGNARSINSISIPASVTSIGHIAFPIAGPVTSITVDGANANYSSFNGVLFNKAATTLIAYPVGKSASEYAIPSSVTTIGMGAFCGAYNLTSVTIPASVISVGDNAFFAANSLTSVNFLGDAPENVGGAAFVAAGARAYITSGASGFGNPGSIWNGLIVTIGRPGITFPSDGTYDCNTGLSSTAIPNYTITNGEVLNGANCRGAVVIPEGVTAIGYLAFSNSSITRVIIPSTVASIGLFAFDKATALTSIYVARANETFSSIDGVLFNKDVTELIKYPQGNTQTNYIIPATVSSLEIYAFSKVASLQYIDVMNGNADFSSIGGVLFNSDVSTLVAYPTGRLGNKYSIPTIVTRIGNTAFYGTPLLANVTIPNSVTSIGGWAFNDMASLTSITVPASVSSIESNAFEYESILTEITFLGSVDSGIATDGTIKLPRVGGTKYTLNGWYSDASFQTKVGDGGSDYNASSAVTLHAKITRNPVKAEALTKPTISGKAISTVKGTNKLTAKKGTWTGYPTPSSFTYQWYSCTAQLKSVLSSVPRTCAKISRATSTTLAVTNSHKGKYLAVLVTGRSAGTSATISLSKSTAKVK